MNSNNSSPLTLGLEGETKPGFHDCQEEMEKKFDNAKSQMCEEIGRVILEEMQNFMIMIARQNQVRLPACLLFR